jgi:uncharacterized protein YjbI with pentapeptide repeats
VVLHRYAAGWINGGLALGASTRHTSSYREVRKVAEEQKSRERSFIGALVPAWRPTREQILWTVRIVIVLVLLLGTLTLIGLPFEITLWEWMKLLIVPAVIAAGGLWFNRQQRDREMEIAEQRAQDEALQAFLEQISQLLTDEKRPLRRAQPGDDLSAVARARTSTVLRRVDSERKGRVVQFLYEAGLIRRDRLVLGLINADLEGAPLSMAELSEASLRGANLSGADLMLAKLGGADLRDANLSGANIWWAYLRDADLRGANLHGAVLWRADLRGANLVRADLTDADLSEVKGITNEELEQHAGSLERTTMPNGQKYEDWLKSKDRGEDGENTSSP